MGSRSGGTGYAGMAAILCAAFAVRALLPILAYAVARDDRIFAAPDTASYLACAESIVRSGRFAGVGGAPEIVRTPGYPLLLVPGVALGRVAPVTVALQVILGCITVWLVHRMTILCTGDRRAATAAGFLCAFEPLSVLYCGILLAESLFAALLMLFLYFFIRSTATGSRAHLAAAACAISAAVYVRPIAYWLPALMAVILAVKAARGRTMTAVFRPVGFLSLCAALIGTWQVRNGIRTGYWGFSAIGDVYLYFYQGAAVLAAERGESYYAVQERMGYRDRAAYFAQHPGQTAMTEAEHYEWMGRQGRGIMLARPMTFAVVYAKGIGRTLFDPGSIDYMKFFGLYMEGSGLLGAAVDRGIAAAIREIAARQPALLWCSLILEIFLLLYFVLAALGLFHRSVTASGWAAAACIGLYLVLLSGGANALGRFRHPVMPLVCALGGAGLSSLMGQRPRSGGSAR